LYTVIYPLISIIRCCSCSGRCSFTLGILCQVMVWNLSFGGKL